MYSIKNGFFHFGVYFKKNIERKLYEISLRRQMTSMITTLFFFEKEKKNQGVFFSMVGSGCGQTHRLRPIDTQILTLHCTLCCTIIQQKIDRLNQFLTKQSKYRKSGINISTLFE